MKAVQRLYQFVVTCIISGILFFIPIGIIFILFEKIILRLRKVVNALHLNLSENSFLHILINNLILILLLLLCCFLAGLFFRFKWVKKLIKWLEHHVLQMLPGYDYIKGIIEDALGVTGHKFQEVILHRQGDSLQLCFKVESISTTMMMIFIPGVPKPRSGSILIVANTSVITTALTSHQAFALLRGMGSGAADLAAYIK